MSATGFSSMGNNMPTNNDGLDDDEGYPGIAHDFESAKLRITTIEAELAKVTQERDAAVADAERYRWLAKKAFTDERDGGYVRFYVFPHITYADGSTFEGRKPTYYTTLNAAIDAARKEGV